MELKEMYYNPIANLLGRVLGRYRTDNTRSLDKEFDPRSKFNVTGTLGKLQWEETGEVLLREAKRHGYFVALPVKSLLFGRPSPNLYLFDMSRQYLNFEELGNNLTVSPTRSMCSRMYPIGARRINRVVA